MIMLRLDNARGVKGAALDNGNERMERRTEDKSNFIIKKKKKVL